MTDLGVEEVDATDLPFESIEYSDDAGSQFPLMSKKFRTACKLPNRSPARSPSGTIRTPPGVLISPDTKWGVLTRGGDLWLAKHGDRSRVPPHRRRRGALRLRHHTTVTGRPCRSPTSAPVNRRRRMASEWSPDSSRVVVTKLDDRHVAEYPWLVTAPADGSFRPKVYTARIPLQGEEPARVEWFVVHIPSGDKVRLDLPYDTLFHVHQDMLAIRNLWWNDDSSHLYAIAWGDNLEAAYLFDIDASHQARCAPWSRRACRPGWTPTPPRTTRPTYAWSATATS